MSAASAYPLRSRDRRFADGWDAAGLIARARLADDLADRAINGCVEQIWRDGCIVGERHRHDNRLSFAVLRRLDTLCDFDPNDRTRAQQLTGAWDAYLTAIEEGRDDDAAALALARPVRTSEVAPQFGVGTPSTLLRQLVHLRAGLALDERADGTNIHDGEEDEVYEDEDEDDDGLRAWVDDGSWRTDFPPPDDFYGDEVGMYGDEDYHRACTPREADLLDARYGRPGEEQARARAEDEAERNHFFAALADPDNHEFDLVDEEEEEEDADTAPSPVAENLPSPLAGEGWGEGPAASAAEETSLPQPAVPPPAKDPKKKRRPHPHL